MAVNEDIPPPEYRQVVEKKLSFLSNLYTLVWPIDNQDRPGVPPVATKEAIEGDREYLNMMFEERAKHARQHETMRAMATGLFMALIAGLLAFAVGDGNTKIRVWAGGLLVCMVSIVGAAINQKHTERYRYHAELRDAY